MGTHGVSLSLVAYDGHVVLCSVVGLAWRQGGKVLRNLRASLAIHRRSRSWSLHGRADTRGMSANRRRRAYNNSSRESTQQRGCTTSTTTSPARPRLEHLSLAKSSLPTWYVQCEALMTRGRRGEVLLTVGCMTMRNETRHDVYLILCVYLVTIDKPTATVVPFCFWKS